MLNQSGVQDLAVFQEGPQWLGGVLYGLSHIWATNCHYTMEELRISLHTVGLAVVILRQVSLGSWLEDIMQMHASYCKQHGSDFVNSTSVVPISSKFELLSRTMQGTGSYFANCTCYETRWTCSAFDIYSKMWLWNKISWNGTSFHVCVYCLFSANFFFLSVLTSNFVALITNLYANSEKWSTLLPYLRPCKITRATISGHDKTLQCTSFLVSIHNDKTTQPGGNATPIALLSPCISQHYFNPC